MFGTQKMKQIDFLAQQYALDNTCGIEETLTFLKPLSNAYKSGYKQAVKDCLRLINNAVILGFINGDRTTLDQAIEDLLTKEEDNE